MSALVLAVYVILPIVVITLVLRARNENVRRKAVASPPAASVKPISNPTTSSTERALAVRPESVWIPPGRTVIVAGRTIPGGMLFVGKGLQVLHGTDIEPALIVPDLQVSSGPGALTGAGMTYWPSYSHIGPDHRAAYLDWLATGRKATYSAYIGYVFLFFYGLERRLIDPSFPCSAEEVGLIADEVERLLETFGSNGSFQGYAERFLEDVLLPRLPGRPLRIPAGSATGSVGVPSVVRIALQRCATFQTPIPPELAYRWAVASPFTRLATPAQRCHSEFHRLFLARYAVRFGEGLKIKGRLGRDSVVYQPASAGFGGSVLIRFTGEHLPRTVPEQIPGRLQELIDECVAGLDGYSRWIGRNPGRERTVAALALLPRELVDSERRQPVDQLVAGIEASLASGPFGTLRGAAILSLWPRDGNRKFGQSDYVGMAQLLEKLGYGVEPDVRFGGRHFESGDPIILYRLPGEVASSPSADFFAAGVLLHLAALVAIADGTVSAEELTYLLEHLKHSMKLTDNERLRLEARFHWVVSSAPSFMGIKQRVADFSPNQREALGEFLVTVAGADGVLAPKEIDTLQRIYECIGIDPARLYSHIHALSTDASRDDGPVTVIPAGGHPRAHRIPTQSAPASGNPSGIQLNAALVERKLQQSAAVTALLGTVFASDELPPKPTAAALHPAVQLAAGLDAAHSSLLRRVAERDSWPRTEFDAVADSLTLLPEGALDTLNGAAYETTGGPVLEDGDPMTVDREVLAEMLR